MGFIGYQVKKFLLDIILMLRPLFAPQGACKYLVSCTDFAKIEFEEKTFIYAFLSILKRVLSCHPFSKTSNIQ